MTMVLRAARALGLVAAVALTASCGNSPTEPTAPAASPTTESYSSLLSVKGASSRSFIMLSRGSVSVRLSATTPAETVVGLGIGIPRADGFGCLLNSSVQTAAGAAPQIAVQADAGYYCAQIYDVGNLTDQLAFTIAIVHP